MRKLSLESRILLAFLVGACALLGAVAFAFIQGMAYLDADQRSDELHSFDLAVSRFYLSMRNAESGQRGFLLTGRDVYLVPYKQAVADVPQRYDDMLAASAVAPELTDTVTAMQAPMKLMLTDFAHSIDLQRSSGRQAALAVIDNDHAAFAMRSIREASDGLHAKLQARLYAAATMTRTRFNRASVGITVVTLLMIMALAAACYTIIWDVAKRRRMASAMEREANHDALTGLPNRRFFSEWLAYAMAQARRDNTSLGLMCIDLDGFKNVNDRHGHKAGDALLVDVAQRFATIKRDSDVLARLGGDEFVIAAAGATDGREVAALAERLIAVLTEPSPAVRDDMRVGASIGIAFFPDDATDLAGLMAAADSAMYTAKREGKNRVAFHALA